MSLMLIRKLPLLSQASKQQNAPATTTRAPLPRTAGATIASTELPSTSASSSSAKIAALILYVIE